MKRPRTLIQADIAFMEVWRQRDQVQYKHEGPTIVTELAPGKAISTSKNKEFNRVVSQNAKQKTYNIKKISKAKASNPSIS